MPSVAGTRALHLMVAGDISLLVALLSLCLLSLCLLGAGASVKADEPARMTMSELFEKQIQPLLVRSCGKCHGTMPEDNDLDLTSFKSAQVILSRPKMLCIIADRVYTGDMPPKDEVQLSQGE